MSRSHPEGCSCSSCALNLNLLTPPMTGYELACSPGMFGVFVPEAGENLIPYGSNPTTDHLCAISCTDLEFVFTEGRSRGAVQIGGNNAGAGGNRGFSLEWDFVAGHTYTFSLAIKAPHSTLIDLMVAFEDPATQDLGDVVIRTICATGFWQSDDVYVVYPALKSGKYRLSVFTHLAVAGQFVWYADEFQLEIDKEYRTSFISGYFNRYYPGHTGYSWSGTEFVSSSLRSQFSRAGGRLRRFADTGFRITGSKGLGMPGPRQIYNPYAMLHGSYHQRRRFERRPFQIMGQFTSRVHEDLMEQRYFLQRLLMDHDVYGSDPLTMRYQLARPDGSLIGRELQIHARYSKGLEGDHTSHFGEVITLDFVSDSHLINEPGDFGSRLFINNETNVTTKTLYVQSVTDAPSYGWIGIIANSGRLLKIENKTNGQVINFPAGHTFVANEYMELNSNYMYTQYYAINRIGGIAAPVNNIVSELAAGNHLSSWYCVPMTAGFDGLNEIVFTFDPAVTIYAELYLYYMRCFYGIDVANIYLDME